MKHDDSRYVVAFDAQKKELVGFIHFRFEIEEDDNRVAVYW